MAMERTDERAVALKHHEVRWKCSWSIR